MNLCELWQQSELRKDITIVCRQLALISRIETPLAPYFHFDFLNTFHPVLDFIIVFHEKKRDPKAPILHILMTDIRNRSNYCNIRLHVSKIEIVHGIYYRCVTQTLPPVTDLFC